MDPLIFSTEISIFADDYEEEDDTTEDTGRSSPPALPPKRTGTANRGKFYQPCSSDSVSARCSKRLIFLTIKGLSCTISIKCKLS